MAIHDICFSLAAFRNAAQALENYAALDCKQEKNIGTKINFTSKKQHGQVCITGLCLGPSLTVNTLYFFL